VNVKPIARRIFWRRPKPTPVEGTVTMYDSVNVAEIPRKAEAVAGYVDGLWPTWLDVVREFPRAHKVSIAVTAKAAADCLDIERGDAAIADAAAWVKRQRRAGAKRPIVYTSASNAAALLEALEKAGLKRTQFRLWTAHYTNKQHCCSAACGYDVGADATQWSPHALGRNLDVSLCAPGFFAI